jgi:diguanylate cyclase (GGDEF)-like protein
VAADHSAVEEAEIRYRAESVRAAMLPTHALCVVTGAYLALTWDEPNRSFLGALTVIAVLSMLVLNRLPLVAIVRGRWGEVFFVSWSIGDVLLIAAAVAADGGVNSPLTLSYLFPLLFASLSYPMRSAAVVYATALSSYAFVGLALSLDPDPPRVLMGVAALGFAPFVGFLQAREHSRERRELTITARTDALTGLLNHTAFQERLAAELDLAAGSGTTLALIALDIDHFKAVNDRHGHAAGDAALVEVAEALRSVVRPGDVCGRIGGDEFMLALPGASPRAAQHVADRARLALTGTAVTVSAGIAVFPDHATDRTALMHFADAAMYASKQRGRNRTTAAAGVLGPRA